MCHLERIKWILAKYRVLEFTESHLSLQNVQLSFILGKYVCLYMHICIFVCIYIHTHTHTLASLVAQKIKVSARNVRDLGLIPELGRSPEEGNSYLLQYSCLENPHGQRSLAGYSLWGHKSWTWLSAFPFHIHIHTVYRHIRQLIWQIIKCI